MMNKLGSSQVHRAKDCVLDAWMGAAQWAESKAGRQGFITKAEWAEKGGEYIKEHSWGMRGFRRLLFEQIWV